MDRAQQVGAGAAATGNAAAREGWRPIEGAACANCETSLTGRYCHACGQLAESFERSVWSLLREALESFFDADARIFSTLPGLILRPATLTGSYLAGRRASQTPPLRLFLVVIVLVFFAGGLRAGGTTTYVLYQAGSPTEAVPNLPVTGNPAARAFARWLNPRLNYAVKHQQEFGEAFASWLPRAAVMFLPLATLLLGLIFVFRRKVFLFDHAIFSMHSLSFMGLLFTLIALVGMAPPLRGVTSVLVLAAPAHLFVHMRGYYGTSAIGTLLRMTVLFALSALGVAALLLVVVGLDLNGMGSGAA
jgi:hypothetical protein